MVETLQGLRAAAGLHRQTARKTGAFRWDVALPPTGGGLIARCRRWFEPNTDALTVFHVTHQKAGSQWINRIFHGLAYDRLVHPEVRGNMDYLQFTDRPIQAGKVYPTVYVTREQFENVTVPHNSRRFIVIRDLRDTLVSGYFGFKVSQTILADELAQWRAELVARSLEDGLLFLMEAWLPRVAAIQSSWIDGPDDVLKYEDLLVRDEEVLERVLLGHCRLGVSRAKFREVIQANRFEVRSGRRPGQEDLKSHERKGVAGDWRNHFTDKVVKAFKDRFGSLLVATQYEAGFGW